MPKTSTVPSHQLNPETQDQAVLTFIGWAYDDLQRSTTRFGERKARAIECFTANMGLAAYSAEKAATLRGHGYSLLPNRDRSIDEVFAHADGVESRQVAA